MKKLIIPIVGLLVCGSLPLSPEAFKIHNNQMQYVAEPGEFVIMAGPHSQQLSAKTVRLLGE